METLQTVGKAALLLVVAVVGMWLQSKLHTIIYGGYRGKPWSRRF